MLDPIPFLLQGYPLPTAVEAILLPFEGRIVTNGQLRPLATSQLSPEARARYAKIHEDAAKTNRILTQFPDLARP